MLLSETLIILTVAFMAVAGAVIGFSGGWSRLALILVAPALVALALAFLVGLWGAASDWRRIRVLEAEIPGFRRRMAAWDRNAEEAAQDWADRHGLPGPRDERVFWIEMGPTNDGGIELADLSLASLAGTGGPEIYEHRAGDSRGDELASVLGASLFKEFGTNGVRAIIRHKASEFLEFRTAPANARLPGPQPC